MTYWIPLSGFGQVTNTSSRDVVRESKGLFERQDELILSPSAKFAVRIVEASDADPALPKFTISCYIYNADAGCFKFSRVIYTESDLYPTRAIVHDEGYLFVLDIFLRSSKNQIALKSFNLKNAEEQSTVYLKDLLGEKEIQQRFAAGGYGVRWLTNYYFDKDGLLQLGIADINGQSGPSIKWIQTSVSSRYSSKQ